MAKPVAIVSSMSSCISFILSAIFGVMYYLYTQETPKLLMLKSNKFCVNSENLDANLKCDINDQRQIFKFHKSGQIKNYKNQCLTSNKFTWVDCYPANKIEGDKLKQDQVFNVDNKKGTIKSNFIKICLDTKTKLGQNCGESKDTKEFHHIRAPFLGIL